MHYLILCRNSGWNDNEDFIREFFYGRRSFLNKMFRGVWRWCWVRWGKM